MSKKTIQFQIAPMVVTKTVMGLIKGLYKELAKNDLGKTLLIGKFNDHLTDESWSIEDLDDESQVHFKETEHAIHVIFVPLNNIKNEQQKVNI